MSNGRPRAQSECNPSTSCNVEHWAKVAGACCGLSPLLMLPLLLLLIWSQLHHLRATVHYKKSVVSCQSPGRCRTEPVWDLSCGIKVIEWVLFVCCRPGEDPATTGTWPVVMGRLMVSSYSTFWKSHDFKTTNIFCHSAPAAWAAHRYFITHFIVLT